VVVEENQLGLDWPDRFKARVSRVTTADVRRVATTYMDPATFSSVIVGKQTGGKQAGGNKAQRAVLKYFRTYSLFSGYQRLPRCPPYGYSIT
jgi:hypothetical protein